MCDAACGEVGPLASPPGWEMRRVLRPHDRGLHATAPWPMPGTRGRAQRPTSVVSRSRCEACRRGWDCSVVTSAPTPTSRLDVLRSRE